MEKPIVGIISDANALALAVTENLLSNFCRVKVFAQDKKDWRSKTSHIVNSQDLEILTRGDLEKEFLTYFIYINLQANKKADVDVKKIQESVNKTKGIFVFSYYNQSNRFIRLNQTESMVFVGDLIGARIDLKEDKPLNKILEASLIKKTKLVCQSVFYPVFIPDVARVLVKWLFSFGPYPDKVALVSKPVSVMEILSSIKKNLGELNMEYKEGNDEKTPDIDIRRYVLNTNLNLALKETFRWHLNYKPQDYKEVKTDEVLFKKPLIALLLVLFFLLPFIMTIVSSLTLIVGGKEALKGRISIVSSALFVSKKSAVLSAKESYFLALIPLVGGLYKENLYLANLLSDASSIGEEGIALYRNSNEFSTKVLGDEVYDPEPYSQRLSLGFDSLYKDISFFQGEIKKPSGLAAPILSKLLGNLDLEEIKNIVLNTGLIAKQISQLVGSGKSVTYLVLLQNNMELRPTGGFIGSFALVTFNGGRLTDINVQDVYSADGQLKGHVEPPSPIKSYLGEAGWYLRDSNWDPDFSVSSQRAEWFLDKELDKSVDGVVSLDLEPIKGLLSALGPIYLSDFNTQIDAANFYLKTQNEVESKFFPGSIKKASFLTSLTREIMTKLTKEKTQNQYLIAKTFFSSLNEKHIQVFLHNKEAQKGISNLNWDGGVATPSCSQNCYFDWLGMVEANLGVNKANFFVKRSSSLEVVLDLGKITNKLTLDLENTAPRTNILANKYKNYLRILIPQGSNLESVSLLSSLSQEKLTPEITQLSGRKEIGVLVEILPGEKKEVVFKWSESHSLDFSKPGELDFYWRKQAGTTNDPISINFVFPDGLVINGNSQYNTTLARDFFSRVSWK